jgi:hypothetical protein
LPCSGDAGQLLKLLLGLPETLLLLLPLDSWIALR